MSKNTLLISKVRALPCMGAPMSPMPKTARTSSGWKSLAFSSSSMGSAVG